MKERKYKEPKKTHVAHLGAMDAHISEAGDGWSRSAIRVNFTSGSDWLLTPDNTGIEKAPSAADKMVAIIKRGLLDEGMDVIDDRAPNTGTGYGIGGRFSRQLQTDTFHSFHPGDDGVVINAERGRYPMTGGSFTAAVIASEASEIADRMAYMMRNVRNGEDTAEEIGRIYRQMELSHTPVKDLLPEIPDTQAAEDRRENMIKALMRALPSAIFPDEAKRAAAVGAIADGVIGTAGQSPWKHAREEGLRGCDDDPLRKTILQTLTPYTKEGTTVTVRGLMAGQACDAAYAVLVGHHADYPGHL